MTALELARFALYADLGLAFGVPAAAVLTRAQSNVDRLRPVLVLTVLICLPISLLGYLLTVAEMAGAGLNDLDWQLVRELTTGTAIGRAFLARVGVLLIAATFILRKPSNPMWLAMPAAVALGTLAWSGHAAASEGMLAAPRLAFDILHLFAASIWLGALVLFLAMLSKAAGTQAATGGALARFAGIGGALVVTLGLTGIANLWFLAPPRDWLGLVQTGYGALLSIKLVLFSAMLGLAGLNRFALVPRLVASGNEDQGRFAVRALRISIALEFVLALTILLVVARLGMLDPGGP